MTEADIFKSLNIGTAKSVLQNTDKSPLALLLEQLTNEIINDLVEATHKRDINASGKMSASISITDVETKGSEISVGIFIPSEHYYWKYINYGVNGTEVNHGAPSWGTAPSGTPSFKDSIKSWVQSRGVVKPDSFSNYDSFAFAIMNSIKKKGKAPRPFFEDVVNKDLIPRLKKPIEKLLGRSIKLNIIAPWQ